MSHGVIQKGRQAWTHEVLARQPDSSHGERDLQNSWEMEERELGKRSVSGGGRECCQKTVRTVIIVLLLAAPADPEIIRLSALSYCAHKLE